MAEIIETLGIQIVGDNSSAIKALNETSEKLESFVSDTGDGGGGLGIGSQIARLGDKFVSAGSAASEMGQNLNAAIRPAANFLAEGEAAYSEFADVINLVGVEGSLAADELRAVSDRAKELGRISPKGPTDAAEGMLELVRAGQSVEEAMITSKDALDLASIGSIGMEKSAGILVTGLEAWKLSAGESSRVTDALSRAARASRADVGDLGSALTYVAPRAAAMGESIEDTAAALAVLSQMGVKGSRAGNDLRRVYDRLINPTAAASDKLNELGISAFDAQGEFVGLQDVVDQLNEVFDTGFTPKFVSTEEQTKKVASATRALAIAEQSLSEKRANENVQQSTIMRAEEQVRKKREALEKATAELSTAEAEAAKNGEQMTLNFQEQQQALSEIFGVRGQTTIQTLMEAGGIEEMRESMSVLGSASEAAEQMNDSYKRVKDSFEESMTGLKMAVSEHYLEGVKKPIMEATGPIIDSIASVVQEVPELGMAFGLVTETVGGLGSILTTVGPVLQGLGGIMQAFGEGGMLANVASNFSSMASSISATIGPALAAAAPYLALAAAIGALIKSLEFLHQSWSDAGIFDNIANIAESGTTPGQQLVAARNAIHSEITGEELRTVEQTNPELFGAPSEEAFTASGGGGGMAFGDVNVNIDGTMDLTDPQKTQEVAEKVGRDVRREFETYWGFA